MARMARVVVPGYPHHVTQRGNRKQRTFFGKQDYREYLSLLTEALPKADLEIWAWCLMPNHVHLVVVPEAEDSLARLFRHVHQRYTRRINKREGWIGHLWQERFHSFVMDEQHLLAAVRYIELNPVRAGLCVDPVEWAWSSVHAHLAGTSDDLVRTEPMLQRISDWRDYLADRTFDGLADGLRAHSRTGRPAGGEAFIERIEMLTGRQLKKRSPGPAPRR